MQLGNQLSISEHQFFAKESLSPDDIKLEEGVSILAIRRRNGQTEALSSNVGLIEPGDSLILFGPDGLHDNFTCLLYTSPSPRDATLSRMPSSA